MKTKKSGVRKTEKNGQPAQISTIISMHWTETTTGKQEPQDYGHRSHGNGQDGDGDGDPFYGQNGEGETQRQDANEKEGEDALSPHKTYRYRFQDLAFEKRFLTDKILL